MPQEGCLMYCCSNRVEFAGQMPPFDEWGLRPVGLVGPRENPVTVVPLLAAVAELAPRVDAGGQAPLEARGAGAEVSTPPEAPEASSSGSRDSRPWVAVEGVMRSIAPGVEAPEASAGHRGAEADGSPHLGAPEVVSSSASPAAPCIGRHVQHFGRLRVDFEALRKRKGSPSCSSGAFRPLKQRKIPSAKIVKLPGEQPPPASNLPLALNVPSRHAAPGTKSSLEAVTGRSTALLSLSHSSPTGPAQLQLGRGPARPRPFPTPAESASATESSPPPVPVRDSLRCLSVAPPPRLGAAPPSYKDGAPGPDLSLSPHKSPPHSPSRRRRDPHRRPLAQPSPSTTADTAIAFASSSRASPWSRPG
nr:BRD4-interacting chromatin-remodeling complex-associated protein-like [Aegilops tauschii subsp. strangulata]